MGLLLRALVTGTVASLVSTGALMILARGERKGAWQPTNATSHWLHGDQAAARRRVDMRHTGLGFATHHVSAIFWALFLEKWLGGRRRRASTLLKDGAVMSAIAGIVDYGLTPKRLTPGWENVLSLRAMMLAYLAMALGLSAGTMITRAMMPERDRPRAR